MTTWIVAKPVGDPAMQARLQWVADMLTAAGGVAARIGVSPEAIVAQAAQETGWGETKQGRFGLFGEKAGANWTGLKVLCPTREWDATTETYTYEEDWFRDFGSLQECLEEHFDFLNTPHWHQAGVWDRLGDEHFFAALKKGGYATDPNYVANCIAVEDTVSDYYVPHLSAVGRPLPPHAARILHIGVPPGDDVKLVQDTLRVLGFYHGNIDGDFGRLTRDAVRAAQEAKHIEVDGVVGDETRGALGLA
jgi:hypothetical protein